MTTFLGWTLAVGVLALIAALLRGLEPADLEDAPGPGRAETHDLGLPWYDPVTDWVVYPPDRLRAASYPVRLELTQVDVLYIAGAWAARPDGGLPDPQVDVHLPSGRVLTGQEVGDFVRWIRTQ